MRTSTYQSAMLLNTVDFTNKVIIDVGAGSGILSFFAVQAGAKRVYAVEASSMAVHCQMLVKANKHSNKIVVIAGKVEEIDIPEKVDMIISEPMGYMLFNERMLESYVHARKWLKPEGKMFPSQAVLYCAPYTDELLYMEQFNKISFWYQQHFHGVDLSPLKDAAKEEYFKQPVVDSFDCRILMAKPFGHSVDFGSITESSLYTIEFPLSFTLWQTGNIHGLAFWFDVAFIGTQQTVWLSTAPSHPLTHWYQVRCLFSLPLFASAGQEATGHISMKANQRFIMDAISDISHHITSYYIILHYITSHRQSYDIEIELRIVGTSQIVRSTHDLKNPYFRYTGAPPQPPPGCNNQNPTEAYWSGGNTGPVYSQLLNGIPPSPSHPSLPPTSYPAMLGNQPQPQQHMIPPPSHMPPIRQGWSYNEYSYNGNNQQLFHQKSRAKHHLSLANT
jgi:histone-arginine methyltransferase CARM1